MESPEPTIPGTIALIAGGFTRVGVWRRHEDTIRFDGETALPKEAGVYAYATRGVIQYVGSAQRGLRGRLRRYEITKTMRTSRRVRQEIITFLTQDEEVEVYVIVPPPLTLNGLLPIDVVAGLEEGLIRAWRPAWNRRGMGKLT